MAWELEPWQPADDIAQDTGAQDTGEDVIDVAYRHVDEPSLEPVQESAWGSSWNSAPVAYADNLADAPDVRDASFSFLEPDESQLPVRSSGWGLRWQDGRNSRNSRDSTDGDSRDSDIERYTAASFTSDPEPAYWQAVGERDALPDDTGAMPTADFWAQTTAATSQVTDTFTDARSNTQRRNQTRHKSRAQEQLDTYTPPKQPSGHSTPTRYGRPGSSVAISGEGGTGQKDYGWYFIAEDDPREDADIHALRHWYFLYEFGDGFEEWDEAKFHAWVDSLKGGDYELFVNAGREVMDNQVLDNLKSGTLKTAYLNMRLEGDSPDSERHDALGRVAAWLLRGFA